MFCVVFGLYFACIWFVFWLFGDCLEIISGLSWIVLGGDLLEGDVGLFLRQL